MKNTVLTYLESAKESFQDKSCVVYGENEWTYAEVYEASLSVASWIHDTLNCTGKPIVVLMHNTPEAFVSFWGIAYSANIYVPLDSLLPTERLRSINDVLKPAGVICCDAYDERYSDIFDCPIASFEEAVSIEFNPAIKSIRELIIDTDPLYILFTSGSTGVPKGVCISHKAVIDFTEEASEAMDFSDKEIFLNQAPFYFDASVPDIYCTVRNGATLHLIDHKMFSFPIKVVDYIEKKRINAIYWVPSALVAVANLKALGKRNITCLKKIMFCGEVMPTKQLNMWKNEIPDAKYVNYYGPSEATYACSYFVVDREFDNSEALPIGKAAINTDLLIIDEENKKVVDPDVIGELYIRGSSLALGYYNNYEETRKHFVQNPLVSAYPELLYKTGDLVHYNAYGEICFDGRADYQIKHMGYRIELGEIESVVNSIDAIQQTACVYSEDKDIIACFFTGKIEKEEVGDYIKSKLPNYMIPAIIRKVAAMPMNANGKTDRKELKRMIEEK